MWLVSFGNTIPFFLQRCVWIWYFFFFHFLAHINHIRDLIGVDHIGLGGDFNGVESQPIGLEDTSKYPNLFVALLEDETHDWTEDDLAKISSGNLLRVFKKVEEVRDKMKRQDPEQSWIDPNDLYRSETSCQSESS